MKIAFNNLWFSKFFECLEMNLLFEANPYKNPLFGYGHVSTIEDASKNKKDSLFQIPAFPRDKRVSRMHDTCGGN